MPVEASIAARYTLTFQATWSRATHPTDFPPNPHFSPLIGATHNKEVAFWGPGQLATRGIKNMAESGSTTQLAEEVNSAISSTAAMFLIIGSATTSPGSAQVDFEVYQSHPLFTLTTMIAPSPDWFVGVHDLNLFQNGQWVDELVIPLQPYDAGTDSGASFLSPNAATMPPAPIARITGDPFMAEGSVPPLGTFTFKRTDPVCDIRLSQESYGPGEMITAETAIIANPADKPLALELKIWMNIPRAAALSLFNLGADGGFVLPPHADLKVDRVPLAMVDDSFAPGAYELNCRFMDPITGRTLYVDTNAFDIAAE